MHMGCSFFDTTLGLLSPGYHAFEVEGRDGECTMCVRLLVSFPSAFGGVYGP